MWRVRDCKAVVGEHVTTQRKPVVFMVWMEKRREVKSRGRKIIRWRKCRGNVIIEYKERMRARYDQLNEEVVGGGLEVMVVAWDARVLSSSPVVC